ncbi:hypothetical protein [Mesorhizobium sp.]|uniref:P-loop ATPase, Sll1717 family n=1 Tax=Mesorhizobium sp. TaxID=1871066 RepID=UPI001229ABBA|nr:hypothetical protein [Mesorhizobium sp.]TIL44600.1 MAG: hypothetical protein E5Y86_15995 [Mesorhizobium sp.]
MPLDRVQIPIENDDCSKESLHMLSPTELQSWREKLKPGNEGQMAQLVRRSVINFGKTDAKSAMITRDKDAKQLFLNSFVLPASLEMDNVVNGDRYLIYGAKGSGKTALLRYTMEEFQQARNPTKFIVFSEDIPQQEFDKVASGIDIENVTKPEIGDLIQVRDMWTIFLIKNICDILEKSDQLFDQHAESAKLKGIIDGVFDNRNRSVLKSILSKIKGGTFRLKAGVKEYAEFESIINFENDDGTVEVDYSRFAEAVVDRICRISFPNDVKYCLFIDEINLSMVQHKQYKKDSILIRDLILAIGALNRKFIERGLPIYIYGAIRIEVAKGLNVSRNEIDKYLVDHGQRMQWHDGFDVNRYPIFEVIEHRIAAIEKSRTGHSNTASEIWKEYFARDIYGVSPKKFISEITWCNPRDIVNLFNLASASQPSRPRYDSELFSSIAEQYSEIVWSERAEELNAEHSMTVVNAIKRLLAASRPVFRVDQLTNVATTMGQSDQLISQINSTLGIRKICKDLYHIGVLGQAIPMGKGKIDSRGRSLVDFHETWFYRDNREFDDANMLVIHRGLLPCLKLGSWRSEMFGRDPRIVA